MTRRSRLDEALAEHKAALADIIAIAARHPTDSILVGLADNAHRRLKTIGRIEHAPFLTASGFDDLGAWGVNGKLPSTQAWLREARFHDKRLREKAEEVRDAA